MAHDLLRIGDFAKLAETNLRTLRYYEEMGLIEPTTRSDGGFRYYARDQLDTIAAIRRLKELGLSLKEIASTLGATGDGGQGRVERLSSLVTKQIELTETRISSLLDHLAELRSAQQRLAEMCAPCTRELTASECDPCPVDGQPLPTILRALL